MTQVLTPIEVVFAVACTLGAYAAMLSTVTFLHWLSRWRARHRPDYARIAALEHELDIAQPAPAPPAPTFNPHSPKIVPNAAEDWHWTSEQMSCTHDWNELHAVGRGVIGRACRRCGLYRWEE